MNQDRAAELIAMICAKIERFEPAVSTFGALQRYDIAHAIGLVKSMPAQMLVRIKYAGEVSNVGSFEDQLCSAIERGMLSHVEQFGAPHRWKAPRKDFLRDLCRLALVECLSPGLCWVCGGHGGSMDVDGRYHVCGACKGDGKREASDRKRAITLGIDESAWKKSWRKRYHAIQCVLAKYESIGLGGVAKRLSG